LKLNALLAWPLEIGDWTQRQIHLDVIQIHLDVIQIHLDVIQIHLDVIQIHLDVIQIHLDVDVVFEGLILVEGSQCKNNWSKDQSNYFVL
jgi:hypothetical protein